MTSVRKVALKSLSKFP